MCNNVSGRSRGLNSSTPMLALTMANSLAVRLTKSVTRSAARCIPLAYSSCTRPAFPIASATEASGPQPLLMAPSTATEPSQSITDCWPPSTMLVSCSYARVASSNVSETWLTRSFTDSAHSAAEATTLATAKRMAPRPPVKTMTTRATRSLRKFEHLPTASISARPTRLTPSISADIWSPRFSIGANPIVADSSRSATPTWRAPSQVVRFCQDTESPTDRRRPPVPESFQILTNSAPVGRSARWFAMTTSASPGSMVPSSL